MILIMKMRMQKKCRVVFQFEVISKAVFQFRTISFTRIQPKKVKSEYGSGFSSFLFPA